MVDTCHLDVQTVLLWVSFWLSSHVKPGLTQALHFFTFLEKKITVRECVGTLTVVLGWALQNKSMGFPPL